MCIYLNWKSTHHLVSESGSILIYAEFCNGVYKILARHESRFDHLNNNLNQIHSTLQTVLNEIILMNYNLTGCLPLQIGMLKNVTVFDVSFNHLQGSLPYNIGNMKCL